MRPVCDYIPDKFKLTLRPIQRDMLEAVVAAWNKYDIIVLEADVGTGKSLVLQTLALWLAAREKSSAIITPRVALQTQYIESFPGTPVLKGAGRYKCQAAGITNCAKHKLLSEGKYCSMDGGCLSPCPYTTARNKVTNSPNAIFNLQSYMLSQDPRNVLLIDEAHTLFDQLSESHSVSLWQHKYNYPEGLHLQEDVLIWLERIRSSIKAEQHDLRKLVAGYRDQQAAVDTYEDLLLELEALSKEDSKLYNIYLGIRRAFSNFFLEHTEDRYHGTMQPLMRIRPRTLEGLYNPLISKGVDKLVLASATFKQIDIERLGLAGKRVLHLSYPSTFRPEDQPIVVDPVGNMGYKYRDKNMPKLAERILATREKYRDTKGIVHMTYGMAKSLMDYLQEDWVIYHDSKDKEKKLKFFKEKADKGSVFIACGMSTGIDMAGPDFGWQALSKIMYPNRSDALIADWYRTDKKWITWLTTREFIQSCGRINRYLGDKGTTYIWDSCFGRPPKRFGLYQQAAKYGFMSETFKRRLVWK